MRPMPRLAIALGLLPLAVPAFGQQEVPPIDYKMFTLDNGLQVIVH